MGCRFETELTEFFSIIIYKRKLSVLVDCIHGRLFYHYLINIPLISLFGTEVILKIRRLIYFQVYILS